VEIHEEKMFAHLDEEKERNTRKWVLDTEAMNHMSGCRAAFDTTVLGTVRFGDDSVARIEVVGLSCSCARTASPGPSMGSTSSLV
jgi:hypothetical protein